MMQFTNHDLVRVIQTVLFVSGINTLIQTVLGTRLPAVMGNSFYFLLPTISIVLSPDLVSIPDPNEVPYKSKNKNLHFSGCIHGVIHFNLSDLINPLGFCRGSFAPCEPHKAPSSLDQHWTSSWVSVVSGGSPLGNKLNLSFFTFKILKFVLWCSGEHFWVPVEVKFPRRIRWSWPLCMWHMWNSIQRAIGSCLCVHYFVITHTPKLLFLPLLLLLLSGRT